MSASFLAYTSALSDVPTFMLTCDDSGLRWLSASFRALGKRHGFAIGDGNPVNSDGQCVIAVSADPPGSDVALNQTGPGRFLWRMAPNQAECYAALIEGMVACPGACHQYLEAARPDLPVVVVSKGEYDADVLREMRDASA